MRLAQRVSESASEPLARAASAAESWVANAARGRGAGLVQLTVEQVGPGFVECAIQLVEDHELGVVER